MKVRFYFSDKPRERLLSEAFLQGVKDAGDEVEKRALGEPMDLQCDVAVMCGVKSTELFRAHSSKGVYVVYLDKGYSRHTRKDDVDGWEYWRVAVNGHHPTHLYRGDYPADRLEAIGWDFRPWREQGKHIVFAGSSQKYHTFYDLKDPTEYASKLFKSINFHTTRKISYRPKPSWREATPIDGADYSVNESIDQALVGAHALVTHGSNACVEAVLAGVPCLITGNAVAKPISSTYIGDIENLRLASDAEREAWLRFLAYQQWTLSEMASGRAWATIRKQLFQ